MRAGFCKRSESRNVEEIRHNALSSQPAKPSSRDSIRCTPNLRHKCRIPDPLWPACILLHCDLKSSNWQYAGRPTYKPLIRRCVHQVWGASDPTQSRNIIVVPLTISFFSKRAVTNSRPVLCKGILSASWDGSRPVLFKGILSASWDCSRPVLFKDILSAAWDGSGDRRSE